MIRTEVKTLDTQDLNCHRQKSKHVTVSLNDNLEKRSGVTDIISFICNANI